MKKLILILVLAIYSCTAEPIEENPVFIKDVQQCGKIVAIEDRPDADFIYVRMSYHKAYERDCYKVSSWRDYKLGQEICVFDMLEKVDW